MPIRWTKIEERIKKKELLNLYCKRNNTIGEIATYLEMNQSSVYQRLLRLGIKPTPFKKKRYRNNNFNVIIPKRYSSELAEFIGILLGDGHITPTQVVITLGNKEMGYVGYICDLMEKLFKVRPKASITKDGYSIVYLGSAKVVRWLLEMGLSFNKVASQVDVPTWCFRNKMYLRSLLRGLIDTDGSVYKLKFGMQISFCNRSIPLLSSTRRALIKSGFAPSRISGYNIYLTRKDDLLRYFKEIGFSNKKNKERFEMFYFKNGRFV